MWNHLQHLMRITRPSTRRRTSSPRFRGRIEQLEDRTVLSASIGDVPAGLGASAVEPWISAYAGPDRPSLVVSDNAMFYRADTLPMALGGHHEETGKLDRVAWGLNSGGRVGLPPQGSLYVVTVVTIYVPTIGFGLPASHVPATGSLQEPAPASIPRPIAATSPNSITPSEPPPPARQGVAADSIALATGLTVDLRAMPYVTRNVATSPAVAPSMARDAAFQVYAAESLLLAAGDDRSLGADSVRRDGPMWEPVDPEQTAFAEIGNSDLYDEIAASLDALEREREAIDVVLSTLDDVEIEIRAEQPPGDPPPDRQPAGTMSPPDTAESLPPTDDRDRQPASAEHVEGGMVLLQPSGDANHSSDDLVAVFVGGITLPADVPLGVEASVGIYQAVAVGGAPRPSEITSISQARPGYSLVGAAPGANPGGKPANAQESTNPATGAGEI